MRSIREQPDVLTHVWAPTLIKIHLSVNFDARKRAPYAGGAFISIIKCADVNPLTLNPRPQVDDEAEDWEVYWTDTSVSIERIMRLACHQKINHFHGMLEICRKKQMARNLQRMAKVFPDEYDYFPLTFILPNDLHDLAADLEASGKSQTYILKPDAGCQGAGRCRNVFVYSAGTPHC